MAIQTVSGYKLFVHGYDMSGDFNKANLQVDVDELDSTSIEDTSKEFIAGLSSVKFDGEVFAQHGTGLSETVSSANFAVADKLISIYPSSTAGTPGYAFESVQLNFSPQMTIGDISRFTINASKSGSALVRVTDMEGLVTKTSTGNGTARELGAVSATQSLYSFLHVTAVSGTSPTLNVTVRSDSAEAFSSPTTKITHTQFDAIGAELKTEAGAITDTWYRVTWTIGGTDPSFTFDIGVGII